MNDIEERSVQGRPHYGVPRYIVVILKQVHEPGEFDRKLRIDGFTHSLYHPLIKF